MSLLHEIKVIYTIKNNGQDARNYGIPSEFRSLGSVMDLLGVKLVNEHISIITHDYDLKKLFPGDLLIADTY